LSRSNLDRFEVWIDFIPLFSLIDECSRAAYAAIFFQFEILKLCKNFRKYTRRWKSKINGIPLGNEQSFPRRGNTNKIPFTVIIPRRILPAFYDGTRAEQYASGYFCPLEADVRIRACWIPGTDHAGIATQNAVEKALAKEGKHRYDSEGKIRRACVAMAGSIRQHHHSAAPQTRVPAIGSVNVLQWTKDCRMQSKKSLFAC